MKQINEFYINGAWVAPSGTAQFDIINPATAKPSGTLTLGNQADVDKAVAAAKEAFETFAFSSLDERKALLDRIIAIYQRRIGEMAAAVTLEMGAPVKVANEAQAPAGLAHLMFARANLDSFAFEENLGTTQVVKEPIGVVAMITPWNWPINQITAKVAPAIATGCAVVLKPSEFAPYSARLFAEIMDEAGAPKGLFNMIYGTGDVVGEALSGHQDVDMVSFTGSTRAGARVQENAAKTIKRVTQELGGKSANIILDDADFAAAVKRQTLHCCYNTGQTCTLQSRMLVPKGRMEEAATIAAETVESVQVGDPSDTNTLVGPLAHEAQWHKVQGMVAAAETDGAKLVAGGTGKPDGLKDGYFTKPTVFTDVTPDMTIAREEIFGPVMTIIGYGDEEEAIKIANDTPFGLSGAVQSSDIDRARKVARRLRTGNVIINGAGADFRAPFGGYKQSGNGREWGAYAFDEYLELKAMIGFTSEV